MEQRITSILNQVEANSEWYDAPSLSSAKAKSSTDHANRKESFQVKFPATRMSGSLTPDRKAW